MATYKWVRICGGDCCSKCAAKAGTVYELSEEAEAKAPLHPNCKCTAKKVKQCGGDMGVGDLDVSDLDGDYSIISGNFSFSATVTNSSSQAVTSVSAEVHVSVGDKKILDKTFSLGNLGPGESKPVSGSGKARLGLGDRGNVAVVVDTSYTRGGQKVESSNACWK